jgi:Dynamin family
MAPGRGVRLDPPTRSALFGATKLLKDRGLPEVAAFALQRLQPSAQVAPAIVVVGEVKRGKSSLVNVLLGHVGLSPVGVDVATNSFLRFTPPEPDLPEGTARVVLAGERRRIRLDEIADWAAVGGSHVESESGDEPVVRGIEVGITGQFLPGFQLIDTPGVGGLLSSHAQVAKHSATWASVLLFVSDAGQPLTSNELNFLAGLSETVDNVLLAVTKKDRYPSGWKEIVAENRRLLRQRAPRFAEVEMFAVSSQLAARAFATENPATRDALLSASGVPQLAEGLSLRAGNTEQTSIANALRTVRSGLDQVSAQLELRKRAVEGSPELLADLRNERARLEQLSDQQSRWNLDLDRDVGRIRAETVANATREFNLIRDTWLHKIAKEKQAMRASGRKQMMAEISFELESAAQRVANQFYRHLYAVVQQLFADVATAEQMFGAVSFELGRLHPPVRSLRPSGVSKLDPSLITTAFFGVTIGNTVTASVVGGTLAAAMPWMLPIAAGGWLAVNFTYRVIKGGRTQLQAWMQDTIQALQTELVGTTDNVIRDFRPEIITGFREYLAAATVEIKATIKEAESAAAAGRKERQQRLDALDRHLGAVEAQRVEVDRALMSVADAVAVPELLAAPSVPAPRPATPAPPRAVPFGGPPAPGRAAPVRPAPGPAGPGLAVAASPSATGVTGDGAPRRKKPPPPGTFRPPPASNGRSPSAPAVEPDADRS